MTEAGDKSYRYDLFISYHRESRTEEWLETYFLYHFTPYLAQEMAARTQRRSVSIFYDKAEPSEQYPAMVKGIGSQPWKPALADAISSSRCMLGLWSPLYFLQRWCMAELHNFHQRQQSGHPRPIIGISVCGGIPQNPIANAYQAYEFDKFNLTGPGFAKSERFITFQDRIKLLAGQVADAITMAPPRGTWTADLPDESSAETSCELPTVQLGRL
jgi:hypothetical protein